MKYDEFVQRLQELKEDFKSVKGRGPRTMKEFEEFLAQKKVGSVRALKLRSLKGLSL